MSSIQFSDLDLALFDAPCTNAHIVSTGAFEPLSPQPTTAQHFVHARPPLPSMQLPAPRPGAGPFPDAANTPRTPALKPFRYLDTSPVTPAHKHGCAASPALDPLELPTSHSDAGRGLLDAAATYVSRETGATYANGDELRTAMSGSVSEQSVKALLKWVTREPVTLAGAYRPGVAVERAFDAVRAGHSGALDTAMKELNHDVARHVEKKKERKRAAHKLRLKAVEPHLSMDQRETARHRIEASLTKFKKAENEKALHRAMRWLAEQIQKAAAKPI